LKTIFFDIDADAGLETGLLEVDRMRIAGKPRQIEPVFGQEDGVFAGHEGAIEALRHDAHAP
jgi:hypothetical protein